MAEYTSIGWCDATLNFWHGCQKVSEGCKFCYMYRDKEKYGQDGNLIQKTKPVTINRILKELHTRDVTRKGAGIKEPLKVFTCSWSDFFIEEADPWREEAWDIIRKNPEFIWIILTKRPERIAECLPADWGQGWGNVWLMVSAENQARWNERVPILLDVPAKIRGVSIEPLIGPVDIKRFSKSEGVCENCEGTGSVEVEGGGVQCPQCLYEERHRQGSNTLDWIIVGGESGNDTGKYLYRRCELQWIFRIVYDCKAAFIPVFVKQLGTWIAKQIKLKNRAGDKIEEWPEVINTIKFQEFPK